MIKYHFKRIKKFVWNVGLESQLLKLLFRRKLTLRRVIQVTTKTIFKWNYFTWPHSGMINEKWKMWKFNTSTSEYWFKVQFHIFQITHTNGEIFQQYCENIIRAFVAWKSWKSNFIEIWQVPFLLIETKGGKESKQLIWACLYSWNLVDQRSTFCAFGESSSIIVTQIESLNTKRTIFHV